MVSTVDVNIDENFWEHYPNFKAVGPFKKLFTSDKSRGKMVSSKKMWCIALIYDRSSEFYNLPEEGEDNKIDLVYEDFMGDIKWPVKNKAEFESMRDFYQKMTETITMRALRELEEKLDERAVFLKETKYDIGMPNDKGQLVGGTADLLEKMLAGSEKIFTTIEKTRKVVLDEQDKVTRGDVTESLADKGEI